MAPVPAPAREQAEDWTKDTVKRIVESADGLAAADKALADAHNAALAAVRAELEEARQQILNRELRWNEGEEFRQLAEQERDRLRAENERLQKLLSATEK